MRIRRKIYNYYFPVHKVNSVSTGKQVSRDVTNKTYFTKGLEHEYIIFQF